MSLEYILLFGFFMTKKRSEYIQKQWEQYFSRKKNVNEALCVIIDIGTKAARILVGPKNLSKEQWERKDFFNDSILTHLGVDIGSSGILSLESNALQRIIDFVHLYYQDLCSLVSDEDIIVFGTAAFRWIKNREEIRTYFQIQTKLKLNVLSQYDEAYFSLCSVISTHNMRRNNRTKPPSSEDVIMLFDQGGGSMEIAYTTMDFQNVGLHSFDDLGTLALRTRFFRRKEIQKETFEEQFHKLQQYIHNRLAEWSEYPKVQGKKIHAYALGSAAGSLFSCTNFEAHNRVIKKKTLVERIQKSTEILCTDATLANLLYSEDYDQIAEVRKQDEERFLAVYGLPVYVEALNKFRLEEFSMCGYGLRYGVLVGVYRYKKTIQSI